MGAGAALKPAQRRASIHYHAGMFHDWVHGAGMLVFIKNSTIHAPQKLRMCTVIIGIMVMT